MDDIKRIALELAIKANLQNAYDEDGFMTTEHEKLIEGATAIEKYLKGDEA